MVMWIDILVRLFLMFCASSRITLYHCSDKNQNGLSLGDNTCDVHPSDTTSPLRTIRTCRGAQSTCGKLTLFLLLHWFDFVVRIIYEVVGFLLLFLLFSGLFFGLKIRPLESECLRRDIRSAVTVKVKKRTIYVVNTISYFCKDFLVFAFELPW